MEEAAAMKPIAIRRVLIAVYDKSGVVEFGKALVEEFGIEIISTGGTANHLKKAGVPVTLVEEVTGFPEMLDGRVKTLHPKIHAAILADRDNPKHMRQLAEHRIEPIDMVVVNLYPFEKTVADPNCTFEQAIEMIDIGGPCLLRAAAKNHKHVVVVSGSRWYERTLEFLRGGSPESEQHLRHTLAADVFSRTQAYDSAIMTYLSAKSWDVKVPPEACEKLPIIAGGSWTQLFPFRYGENPHQSGGLYLQDVGAPPFRTTDEESRQSLSYNNAVDFDAALGLCAELAKTEVRGSSHEAGPARVGGRGSSAGSEPAVVCFIKHTNACGAALDADPIEAYRKAYLGDPNAAMGGILAVNFEVTPAFAEAVMETYQRWGKAAGAGGFFVEVWLAPSFDDKAVDVIRTKKEWGKRVRLLAVGDMGKPPEPAAMIYRTIPGGMLVQTPDLIALNEDQWRIVTQRAPTDAEMNDLRLAWLICKHTKSNAITICKNGMLLGNGAGQMSRVMSCRIATWLAKENGHANDLRGAVAASDAFFPFRDGPDILMEAGVTALIQPGGSKRDDDTVAACDDCGVAMIFTGTRHFKH
jgi:phosphoribosylaminoimidazolecarboxamide formyltransferase/IMP cyclohydrolase